MSIDVLQHHIERFGAVTVMDVMLIDMISNKPVLFLDTLKISNITAESEMKEIIGGIYADRLITYDYARAVNLEFQDALLSFESMKTLWGAELEREAENIITHNREIVTVDDTPKATLLYTPTTITRAILTPIATGIPAELDVGDGTSGDGDITFTAEALTIDGALEGDVLEIYYEATADDQADTTNAWEPVQALLTSKSFPKTVKLVGKTFFINEASGRKVETEIEFPKLKLNANFSLGLEAEGDASVFDFGGMALSHGAKKELMKVKNLRYLD